MAVGYNISEYARRGFFAAAFIASALWLPGCEYLKSSPAMKKPATTVAISAEKASGTLSEEEKALLAQADAARAQGDRDVAVEKYRKAADLSKGSVRAHLELAGLYNDRKEYAAALDILRRAQALDPKNTEVLKGLGLLLLYTGESAKALQIADAGLALSPEDARFLNTKGIALDSSGKHGAAQALYRQALLTLTNASLDQEFTVNNLALSLIADGKYQDAITLLEQKMPDAINKSVFRQALALAHGAAGNTDKAYELGLIDLNVPQVEENMRFYQMFRENKIDRNILFQPVKDAAKTR